MALGCLDLYMTNREMQRNCKEGQWDSLSPQVPAITQTNLNTAEISHYSYWCCDWEIGRPVLLVMVVVFWCCIKYWINSVHKKWHSAQSQSVSLVNEDACNWKQQNKHFGWSQRCSPAVLFPLPSLTISTQFINPQYLSKCLRLINNSVMFI